MYFLLPDNAYAKTMNRINHNGGLIDNAREVVDYEVLLLFTNDDVTSVRREGSAVIVDIEQFRTVNAHTKEGACAYAGITRCGELVCHQARWRYAVNPFRWGFSLRRNRRGSVTVFVRKGWWRYKITGERLTLRYNKSDI